MKMIVFFLTLFMGSFCVAASGCNESEGDPNVDNTITRDRISGGMPVPASVIETVT